MRQSAPEAGDDSVAGALEGLANGVVGLVQNRIELARHEATAAATTFGSLVVVAAAGLVVLGFGLAAVHLALVLGAFALWGTGVAAVVALGMALVEAVLGGGTLLWAKGRIQRERERRWAEHETRTEP